MYNKTNHNRSFKAMAILLASASIAGLGAITIAATPVGSAITNCFTEDKGTTAPGAVEIHTKSDKVNIEVVGIEGDNANAVGCIRLTNTDGTSFMNEDYFYEYGYEDGFSVERQKSYTEKLLGTNISEPIIDAAFYPENDDAVLICFRYISTDNNCPVGKTLEMNGHTITAVHPVKTVYVPQNNDGKSYLTIDPTGYTTMTYTDAIYDELKAEYSKELNEGYILRPSEDSNSIILASTKTIELDFSLSLKFDYQTHNSISTNREGIKISGAEWNISSLHIAPTSMRLQAYTNDADKLSRSEEPDINNYIVSTSEDGSEQEIGDDYNIDCGNRQIMIDNLFGNLAVTLTDGRIITAKKANYGDCGSSSKSANSFNIDTPYFYYENEMPVTINPADIQTISAHGIVIYQ